MASSIHGPTHVSPNVEQEKEMTSNSDNRPIPYRRAAPPALPAPAGPIRRIFGGELAKLDRNHELTMHKDFNAMDRANELARRVAAYTHERISDLSVITQKATDVAQQNDYAEALAPRILERHDHMQQQIEQEMVRWIRSH
ncbi:hypothetical protein [Antrihabitans sp. YC2-6]|uniref:hypothetical protein n=1 Tax=Antrihabitans sp. YC2-6 TaxID=2799498 RepID=UPI0018F73AB2|nr:hypothetical protein [Antrihabitans sp. YC2-6]MBJ8343920.1 hypothetical protein [Antrihabitans sp. YC2-6]